MKSKILVVISIILIIIILLIIFIGSTDNSKKIINTKNKKCIDIEEKVRNKETFALFITNDLSIEDESNDAVRKYLNLYKDDNIYIIDKLDINKECIKEIIIETGLYNLVEENQNNAVLGYEKGNMTVSQHNIMSYETLEDFLDENNIIKKQIIQEELSFEKFKEKKQQDEYILLIMMDEEKRNFFISNMRKVFKDYDYDVINLRSEEGQKINQNIVKEYKKFNEYPRLLYFKNNKLVKDDMVYGLDTFKMFKENLKSL